MRTLAYGLAGRPVKANEGDLFVDVNTGNTYIYQDGWFMLGQEPSNLTDGAKSLEFPKCEAQPEEQPKKRTRKKA